MLHTGKVLLFFGNPLAALWDPSTGNVQEVPAPADVFCAGQSFLPDGRLLLAGGAIESQREAGPPFVHSFDPVTETWTRHPDMRQGRYYPTTTLLGDGTLLITNGNTEAGRHSLNHDLEVFDPTTNTLAVVGTKKIGLYANQQLLPDGTVVVGGPSTLDSFRIDPATWTSVNLPRTRARHTHAGGFLVPGPPSGSWKMMVTGGDNQATNELFDAAGAGKWQRRRSLPQNRGDMCTVILPDGTVLGVGGETDVGNPPPGTGTASIDGAVYCDLDTTVQRAPSTPPGTPTKQTLLYDPLTDRWTPMAVQTDPRGYHTTASSCPTDGSSRPGAQESTARRITSRSSPRPTCSRVRAPRSPRLPRSWCTASRSPSALLIRSLGSC